MPSSRKRKAQSGQSSSRKSKSIRKNLWNITHFTTTPTLLKSDNKVTSPEPLYSSVLCTKWFHEFTDGKQDVIEPDGMQLFCTNLGVEPGNIVMLVLAYKLHAKNMGYFTLEEWLEGMQKLKCNNMSMLKKKIPYLHSLLDESKHFKDIFRYAFDFAIEQGQRTLEKNSAKLMIRLLFENRWNLVDEFVEFLDVYSKKWINRDQWNNIYEFSKHIEDDCSNYDVDGAWPVLLDEFVDYIKSKRS